MRNILRSTHQYLIQSPRTIAGTFKSTGPAHASLQASLYSLAIFGITLLLSVAVIWIFIAIGLILPEAASSKFIECLVYMLMISPLILGVAAATAAVVLAVLAVLRRSEEPLKIAAAILVSLYILAAYAATGLGLIVIALFAD